MSDEEKHVDESWKDAIDKEKIEEPPAPQESLPTDITFLDYLTSLAFQAMIFLGEVPHPATNTIQKDLRQAKILIDTLLILRQKTQGNLTKEEDDVLNAALYELQVRFVEAVQKEGDVLP